MISQSSRTISLPIIKHTMPLNLLLEKLNMASDCRCWLASRIILRQSTTFLIGMTMKFQVIYVLNIVLKGLKTPGTNSSETPPSETSSRPSSVDWTSTSVTTPKNQGYCGSCWAFAAVGYAESKLIIDGRYDNDIDLSEQVLLECTTDSSCNGGYL